MADDRDRHDEHGEILLGCWDCGSCGARRLRGDAYQCASCGAPRPEDVKFYLPSNAEVVRDQADIRSAEAGPDWQCAFCQSWMPATDTVCLNCQASAAESGRRQKTKRYAAGNTLGTSQGVPPVLARLASPVRNAGSVVGPRRIVDHPSDPHTLPRRPRIIPKIVIAVLGVAAVIYGMNLAGRRHAYQQKLAEHQGLVSAAQQRFDEASTRLNDAARRVELAEQAAARAKSDVSAAQDRAKQLQDEQQAVERATAFSVMTHAWTVELDIEQCAAKEGEGWNHPPDAFDVRSEQRVHHHEQVLDHVETLYRTETYRDQDGFDTETYTERVSAGTRHVEDGYDVEDLGNGRFRRTPRYHKETVYENVTRTRQTPRMVTKTRQIPYENKVYRQDPVRMPWYAYRTKIWTPAPAMSRAGEGLEVLDPEGRPPQNPGSELGAKRVRDRRVSYSLTLQPIVEGNSPRTIIVPDARWRSFADRSTALLARNELFTQQEQQARLASLHGQIEQTTKQIEELSAKVPPLVDRIGPLREQLPPLKQALAKSQAERSKEKQRLEAVVAHGY